MPGVTGFLGLPRGSRRVLGLSGQNLQKGRGRMGPAVIAPGRHFTGARPVHTPLAAYPSGPERAMPDAPPPAKRPKVLCLDDPSGDDGFNLMLEGENGCMLEGEEGC